MIIIIIIVVIIELNADEAELHACLAHEGINNVNQACNTDCWPLLTWVALAAAKEQVSCLKKIPGNTKPSAVEITCIPGMLRHEMRRNGQVLRWCFSPLALSSRAPPPPPSLSSSHRAQSGLLSCGAETSKHRGVTIRQLKSPMTT